MNQTNIFLVLIVHFLQIKISFDLISSPQQQQKKSSCWWRELPVFLLLISLQPSPAPLQELVELWSDSHGQTGLYQTKQDRRRSSAALLLLISQPAPRLKPGRGDRHSLFGPKQVGDRRPPFFVVPF